MGKDPAMLWYWGDWYSGTTLFSRHLKGCYMDLLHAQFNNGPLHLDEIKMVLGADFGSAWPLLQKKFVTDDRGLFFNKRCEEEKIKRQSFVTSRHKNLKPPHKDTHMKPHMHRHMENDNDNDNSNEFKIIKGVRVFGNESGESVTIAAKILGEKPCRIHGVDGIRFFLELKAVTATYQDAEISNFIKTRAGSYFEDDKHLINALNKFRGKVIVNSEKSIDHL